jgi:hypothetical protein
VHTVTLKCDEGGWPLLKIDALPSFGAMDPSTSPRSFRLLPLPFRLSLSLVVWAGCSWKNGELEQSGSPGGREKRRK